MALAGVLIVDLTHVVAGPMATKTLRDLGARVIKVEQPARPPDGRSGDVCRYFRPSVPAHGSKDSVRSAYFATLNAGKESIVLQLDPKAGEAATRDRDVFEALLARADVLVENFRPGVLESLGYGWDALHARFPGLVVASLSGFGQTGPYSKRKAVDTIIQAMSGFITTTGFEEQPVKVGTVVSDLLAGVYCACGVLAALHQRLADPNKIGRRVDVAMLDSSFAFHAREFANYKVSQAEPLRMGNMSPIGVYPFDVFECSGGKLFAVNAAGDDTFGTFCRVLAGSASALPSDLRFSTSAGRWEHRHALRALIDAETKRWDREALLQAMLAIEGHGSFPVGPVNSVEDLSHDQQLAHRRMVVPTQDGRFSVLGNPIKILGVPEPETMPNPPNLNQNSERIRAEFMPSTSRLGSSSLRAKL